MKENIVFLMHYNDKNSGIEYDEKKNPYIELSFKDNTDIWNALIKKIWVKKNNIQKELCSLGIECEIFG